MINAESLIKNLALVDENILVEAATQPLKFIDAARYRVASMRARAQAASELDAKRSRIALTLRARGGIGEKRPTDKSVAEKVETQKIVVQLRDTSERALEREEFSKLILEAYRMRRDAIRVIAETQIAEGMRGSKEVERLEQGQRIRNVARRLEERRRQSEGDDE